MNGKSAEDLKKITEEEMKKKAFMEIKKPNFDKKCSVIEDNAGYMDISDDLSRKPLSPIE